ncbi:MAG: GNAT family N-acetyltransferase [Acidiferrobacterales bacterium]|nr:GNAT family N-acetyltransferase [Acidiferrobacterales bacterium]
MFEIPADTKLIGQFAILEPLRDEHLDELITAVKDGELWNLTCTTVPSPTTMAQTIDEALKEKLEGGQFPFVVRRVADDKIVGSTRYYFIRPKNRNLSIGFTWYSKSAQRTVINTQSKLLLLSYAFETLNCISVAFHVDDTNLVSQAAVKRLGAKHEGVLRNDRIMPDGRIRNTHCFSIIDSEWPTIKEKLTSILSV